MVSILNLSKVPLIGGLSLGGAVVGGGPATYWRILMSPDGGTTSMMSMDEMEMREEVGSPNVALAAYAISGGSAFPSTDAFRLFNNATSIWLLSRDGSDGELWAGQRFPEAKTIKQIWLRPRTTQNIGEAPVFFSVDKSSDGITWEVVAQFNNVVWVGGTWQSFIL